MNMDMKKNIIILSVNFCLVTALYIISVIISVGFLSLLLFFTPGFIILFLALFLLQKGVKKVNKRVHYALVCFSIVFTLFSLFAIFLFYYVPLGHVIAIPFTFLVFLFFLSLSSLSLSLYFKKKIIFYYISFVLHSYSLLYIIYFLYVLSYTIDMRNF